MKRKARRKSRGRSYRRTKHLDVFFLLNWKKSISIVGLWALAVFLHNMVYGLAGFEEPFFFLIAVFVIPAYLIASIVYTLDFHRRKK
ncbi:MAG: hypothetical protein AABY03_01030 [Nanoarchaeota archaeon]